MPHSDEYFPVQVIDYQNRTQKLLSPSSCDQKSPVADHFPRKFVEYDHKSKIHTWNWFCPVIQIEYNHHSKTGFSLHEHPPPPIVKKERIEQHHWLKREPTDQYKQFRQPKRTQTGIISSERLERFAYEPLQSSHQYFQSRYDNSQTTSPSNTQASNELYYRRDWNASNNK